MDGKAKRICDITCEVERKGRCQSTTEGSLSKMDEELGMDVYFFALHEAQLYCGGGVGDGSVLVK